MCGNWGCVVVRAGQALLGRPGCGQRAPAWPRVLWIPAGGQGMLCSPYSGTQEGQRAGRGCVGSCRGSPGWQLERPGRLSELWDRKQTVWIGLLRTAGLSRCSGQQSLQAWIVYFCHLLICSTPHLLGYGSGTSACLLRVPEGLGRGEVFNQGGWSLLLPFCCCAPACSVTFPK